MDIGSADTDRSRRTKVDSSHSRGGKHSSVTEITTAMIEQIRPGLSRGYRAEPTMPRIRPIGMQANEKTSAVTPSPTPGGGGAGT